MAKKSKPKQTKERIVLRVSPDVKDRLTQEALTFGTKLNKYIAVILSHREHVKEGIKDGTIIII